MPDIEGCRSSENHLNFRKIAGERRATDRIVRLWRTTRDKQSVLYTINGSPLWEHCFLFVVDDEIECSVIIDHGVRAARGLALEKCLSTPLSNLSTSLARRIHGLALKSRAEDAPAFDACEDGEDEDMPVRHYRMAVVPLERPDPGEAFPQRNGTNMLGVFTYQ